MTTALQERIYEASRTWKPTAFRGIYFLLKERDLQYVGKSENVITRVRTHWLRCSFPVVPFDRVAGIFLDGSEPFALEQIEATLISALKPPFNTIAPKLADRDLDDVTAWLEHRPITPIELLPRARMEKVRLSRLAQRRWATRHGVGN